LRCASAVGAACSAPWGSQDHWRAEDADGLPALLPELARPRSARDWPVLDTGAALVQGQHALLRGDLAAARALLERAAVLQRGGWLPAFMGDARFALAVCRAMQGELDAAAAALDEVLSESAHEEGLALLAEGQSNKLIARALGLSLHTVKRHVANILTKLALDSRTQAAAHWHRR